MPIENLQNSNRELAPLSQPQFLQTGIPFIAGTQKVKHALMDEVPMLLLGFVVEDEYFEINNFKVIGNMIEYFRPDEKYYYANNDLIYPKIIVDYKKNHASVYFKNETCTRRDRYQIRHGFLVEGNYNYSPDGKGHDFESNYFNFYLFSDLVSPIPECCADNIYAVCKYREENAFKHAIFNLHEITPIV